MESKRIFVDCHVFDGNYQGTTTYIKGLYSNLIEDQSLQFYFAAFDISHLKTVFGEHSNVSYLAYTSHNKFYRLLIEIPSLIKKNNVDYAHFQYIVPPIKCCKYIVTVHDILFLDFPEYFPLSYRLKNKLLFKWSAHKSDIVLTVSEFSKKRIQKYFELDKIEITPNAVDPIFFEKYDKEEVKKKVLDRYGIGAYWIYISRKEPRKNHHRLLKVFVEEGHYKNYSLLLVGSNAIENQQYNTLYDSLSDEIKAKIIPLNKVGFDELLLLLRGANLSIYPSLAEGFGIPPLEAIAADVPSVCSNTTAMSNFDFMGEWQFDPQDYSDMKEIVSKGLNELPNKNLKNALFKKFNWSDSAAKLHVLIK